MKRYYDLYEEKICAMLDWNEGHGNIEDAKKHFKTNKVREVGLKEFNALRNKYCNKSKNEQIPLFQNYMFY
ncbi:hypothetical protein [Clostridium sp. Ade.TY]|uniref:hypothetical protein n=1 Tax=Clostridium sp. Ade.TY TaxID=1391647 RepID=UPI0003FD4516|nr:hypothetical protein [Clostridium sp. Ade.TY]